MFEIVNYGWNDHVIFKMTMENSAVNQSDKNVVFEEVKMNVSRRIVNL